MLSILPLTLACITAQWGSFRGPWLTYVEPLLEDQRIRKASPGESARCQAAHISAELGHDGPQ